MNQHYLGALLLEHPMMREEDLERCLEIQRLPGGSRPLGEILVEEGVISQRALEELLALQDSRRSGAGQAPPVEGDAPDRFLRAAVAAGASELIMSEGQGVMVRIGGQLKRCPSAMEGAEMLALLEQLAGEDAIELLREKRSLRHDYAVEGIGRGRIEAFRHLEGLCVMMRLHPESPRPVPDLERNAELRAALRSSKGLILLSGEVRSGVTETLGALLKHIAEDSDRLVLVLDESLEHERHYDGALVTQRRIGDHTMDYGTGLRSAIPQDADVLVVGDASSPEAFDLCLHAAEAGKLVVAAIGARSVVTALQRALSFYAAGDQARTRATLSSILHCALTVSLVPNVDRTGRVLATELLLVDEAVREVIREGALSQLGLLMRLKGAECGHSMDESLLELMREGQIGLGDAFSRAEDKMQFLGAEQLVR